MLLSVMPLEPLLIIVSAVSALTLVLVAVLLLKSGKARAGEDLGRLEGEVMSLRQEFSATLQQGNIAISSLVTKSDADMRQEMADRLARGFTEIQGRIEEKLSQGREESGRAMTATTESVIKRLDSFGEKTESRILALEKKTSESLDAIREKVSERLMTIGQQVQEKLNENIKEGFAHFEKVQEHLKNAETQLAGVSAVGVSINELNSLLKLPHLRGGFGEAALEMLVADILPAGLYELQAQISPNSAERVDVLVKLPGASLPIDSKFPREQVMPLFEVCNDAKLAEARKTLARVIKEQAKDIASKYIRPEYGTTNMALMFLPSETLYFEVVKDGELWGFLQKQHVFPVSPNTLAVTLKGVTLSYEYYAMAKGVEKTLEDIRKARRHFSNFYRQFDGVGKELDRARDAYLKASTHLGNYSSSVTRLTGEPAGAAEEAAPGLPEPENDQTAPSDLF